MTISYPQDLTKQMLEYSGVRRVESGASCADCPFVFAIALGITVIGSVAGVAQTPAARTFTPERFYNTFSFAHPPALRIKPGERIVTKTIDASGVDWNGKQVAQGPNPQTGPFFVEGAEPGDMLVVTFDKIEINRATAYSGGALAPYTVTPASLLSAHRAAGRRAPTGSSTRPRASARLDGADIGGLELRLRPMLGCVGVAPARKEAIATSTPGRVRRQHGLRRAEPGREGDAAGQRARRAAVHRRRSRAAGRRRSRRHRPRDVDGRRVHACSS